MIKAFSIVFKDWRYSLLAILVFLGIVKIALLLPNIGLIFDTLFAFGFWNAVKLSFVLLGSIVTNNTIYSATGLLLTGLLFGINISLFIFYTKRRRQLHKKVGLKTSTFGFVVGVFGLGCASCGSLAVAGLLSLFGLGGVLGAFPFGGEELIAIGVLLLSISTYQILKKIKDGDVCKI